MAKETIVEPRTTVIEPKYPIEDFRSNAKALGYKPEVVTGALFNCKEKELTKVKFEKKVKDFLSRKVV